MSWKRLFCHSWKRYAAAAAIGLVLTLLGLLRNGFSQRIFYYDALTVAGAALIFIGLLLLVSRLGAFDTFTYAFSALGSDRRYHSLYDYTEAKSAKRRRESWGFMPFISTGLLFLAVGFLFRVGL